MDDEGSPTPETVVTSDLVDVADLDLGQIEALPESVLTTALRRALAERTDPPDHFAAFQNSI